MLRINVPGELFSLAAGASKVLALAISLAPVSAAAGVTSCMLVSPGVESGSRISLVIVSALAVMSGCCEGAPPIEVKNLYS